MEAQTEDYKQNMATPVKQITNNLPTIALVGRVNVGKSSLFNRLSEKNLAVISDTPGTTRTRNIGIVFWRGNEYKFIDTGGLFFEKKVPFEQDVKKQIEIALREADLAAVVGDAETGPIQQEIELAKEIKNTGMKAIVIVNKVDNEERESIATNQNWQRLGLGEPLLVSAKNGRGTGELLDKLSKLAKSKKRAKEASHEGEINIRISILGRPNVGKSTIFNSLIGMESAVVSDIPHTTREPFETKVKWENLHMTFVDTAGIRKKNLIIRGIESEGVKRSMEAAKNSDLCFLVLDIMQSVHHQDKFLAGRIEEMGKSVIIILNKYDQSDIKSDIGQTAAKARLFAQLPFLTYAPVVFVSAKTHKNVHKILPVIQRVANERATQIPAATLHKFLEDASKIHKPVRGKGTKYPKIISFKQTHSNPPIFQITVKYGTSLHKSYTYYLENKLREYFGFLGTPIKITIKKEEI